MRSRIVILATIVSLLFAGFAFAGGTLVQGIPKCYGQAQNACIMTLTWTGSAADGNFTSTAITAAHVDKLSGFYLYQIETDPGSTAPTANYDITLTDSTSFDILGGRGNNKSATLTEAAIPANSTGSFYPVIMAAETYTLAITGNTAPSSGGVIRLYFVK